MQSLFFILAIALAITSATLCVLFYSLWKSVRGIKSYIFVLINVTKELLIEANVLDEQGIPIQKTKKGNKNGNKPH